MNQRYYSNIYWHFTGSPKGLDWRNISCPGDIAKQGSILNNADANIILTKILESQKLLASCTEQLLPGLETEKFCCVTDIPLKDLLSHASYYGKVAIGFNAGAIHKSFLPVLYIPKESLPIIERMVPNRQLVEMASVAFSHQSSFQERQGYSLLSQASANKEKVRVPDSEQIKGFFMNLVKITNFNTSPENTFYREREWRNIGDFDFCKTDVAAIVTPAEFLGEVREWLAANGYPKSISIVAWEFIENA